MNQDNKEIELSGTLGSLSDAALNNLANQTPDETTAKEIPQTPISDSVGDIEMLDVPAVDNQADSLNLNVEPELENNNLNDYNMEPTQLNLNPIPTNFDIGDIGSVPPIDPTRKTEKKKRKKKNILFIFLVIVFILTIGALLFYYLRISKNATDNAVITKDLTLELGEELSNDINDYATFKSISSNNCILNNDNVDTKKSGTYEYSIVCGTKTYTGKITLNDNKAPEVKTKTIVKKVNDEILPEEFISECNEYECTYEFENSETVLNNMKIAGTYDFNIIIKDANANSSTVPVKLIVIDSDIKVYLNCVLSDQQAEGFNGTVSYIDKIGISPDSKYVGLYFRIKEFKATTEEDYNNVKTSYNNGALNINNGEGIPIFDDDNLTISFEDTLSGDSDFGADYSSIKKYYETNKNYKCNILNVN